MGGGGSVCLQSCPSSPSVALHAHSQGHFLPWQVLKGRQEDYKFNIILSYIGSLRLAWATGNLVSGKRGEGLQGGVGLEPTSVFQPACSWAGSLEDR